MDNQLHREFLRQAQEGDYLNRLKSGDNKEAWDKVIELIHKLQDSYDTVKGIRADKEYLVRQSKVDVLDELLGVFESTASQAENAMEELTHDTEED